MSSLSLADAVHPKGTPWILPRLDPGTFVNNIFIHIYQFSNKLRNNYKFHHSQLTSFSIGMSLNPGSAAYQLSDLGQVT